MASCFWVKLDSVGGSILDEFFPQGICKAFGLFHVGSQGPSIVFFIIETEGSHFDLSGSRCFGGIREKDQGSLVGGSSYIKTNDSAKTN